MIDLTPARQIFLAKIGPCQCKCSMNVQFRESSEHTNLNTQTLQADNEDVGLAHPLHSLMTENVASIYQLKYSVMY